MSEEEQLTFIDPTEHINLLTAENAELRAENEKLTAIYHAAELMTLHKELSSTEAPELWAAFHAFDGGSRKPTITEGEP